MHASYAKVERIFFKRSPHCLLRWIASCKNIEEVRLEGNLLGDASGREILQGLQQRKEGILYVLITL